MGQVCAGAGSTADRKGAYKASVLSGSELTGDDLKKAKIGINDDKGNPKGLEGSKNWQSLTVASVKVLTHNVLLFKLLLPHPDAVSGLRPSNHISVRLPGSHIYRSYTAISDPVKEKGHLDFLVKIYPHGTLTGNYLAGVKAGDKLEVCGPRGRVDYRKKGVLCVDGKKLKGIKKIGCICGGTGVSPIFSLARVIAQDMKTQLECYILTANSTGEDALYTKELTLLTKKCDRIFARHTVSRDPKPDWKGSIGRVNEKIIKDSMPPVQKETYIFLCGPAEFMEHCTDILKKLGYDESAIFRF